MTNATEAQLFTYFVAGGSLQPKMWEADAA